MVSPSKAGEPAILLQDVVFTWPGADGFGLEIEHFSVDRGQRLLLMGPSGSGKSTLLSLIAGINVPTRGSVQILGQALNTLSGVARDRFRAEHIGVIFQMFNLLPYASVMDNVLLPLQFAPTRRRRTAEAGGIEQEATRLLHALDIAPDLHRAKANALSVGQQQRVAVARALIGAPEIIIADEPTSALDAPRQTAFMSLLLQQLKMTETTLVLVSHEERLVPHFDTIADLNDVMRRKGGST